MYIEFTVAGYHITAEYAAQEPGNYLLGGFAKYYTDSRHPNYMEAETGDMPPVKMFQTRVDVINRLMEVTISNVRRTRS